MTNYIFTINIIVVNGYNGSSYISATTAIIITAGVFISSVS